MFIFHELDMLQRVLTGMVLKDLFGNTWLPEASQLSYTTFPEVRLLPAIHSLHPPPQHHWFLSNQPSIRLVHGRES